MSIRYAAMKSSVFLSFILIFLTSCGSRNTSDENVESAVASDTLMVVLNIPEEVQEDEINTHPPLALTDSMRLDSVFHYGWIGYENLNEFQVKEILTDYLLYCNDEDGSEGIGFNFGEAFVNDDTFYKWVLDVYSELDGRNKERYERWLFISVKDYTDFWTERNPEIANYFDLHNDYYIDSDKYWYYISTLDIEQIKNIKNIREMFHKGNYDFMEPFLINYHVTKTQKYKA